MISVILPVGPERHHQIYLEECLNSILSQLKQSDELVIIDDMANLSCSLTENHPLNKKYPTFKPIKLHRNLWRLGCADSWNIGIAIAENSLCLMVGADDYLAPNCLDKCKEEWHKRTDPLGYYSLTIQYFDSNGLQELQSLPCNAAMVHKKLWVHTGGFPPETGIGAPDAALISIIMGAKGEAGTLYKIAEGIPTYFVRRHKNQDTAQRGPYQGAILSVRNILTTNWKKPIWGRYD